jgi:hypothetical protein
MPYSSTDMEQMRAAPRTHVHWPETRRGVLPFGLHWPAVYRLVNVNSVSCNSSNTPNEFFCVCDCRFDVNVVTRLFLGGTAR